MMVTDAVVFVGLTTRTNIKGVEALKSFFKQEVIAVPTEKVFHLLSTVNYIGNENGCDSSRACGSSVF